MVLVDVVGGETREGEGETYGDLLAPLDVSRHEVAVLADGVAVPTDAPVDDGVERVKIVRLVRGG
jgi:sulfur carrier protein